MGRQEVKTVEVALTVGTDAYTGNDVVGGLLTFTFGPSSLGGAIRSLLLTDAANQSEQYTVYVYNDTPSTIADDAAFAPTIADLKKLVTTITIATADYTSVNSLGYAILGGHEDTVMDVDFASKDGALYVYLVATDTPDYAAATDVVISMTARLDP